MNTSIRTTHSSLRRQWLAKGAAVMLAAAVAAAMPGRAHAGIFVSVNFAPPPLPVYVQPPIPAPGYIWTPGYWAWDGAEYYWVPGTWIMPPYVGALWTPGWWGWSGGVYLFHGGYWGTHVGFYGGVNYGYGYGGYGYDGGYWHGGGFYYNRSVNHITNNITNVYNRTVINTNINHTSFNGGPGGLTARATPMQAAWERESHMAPVAAQIQQREMASRMPSMRATMNHGMPPIAATMRPGMFNRNTVAPMAARETRYTPMNNAAYRPAGENRYSEPHFNPQNDRQTYRTEPRYSQPTYRQQERYAQPEYRQEPRYSQPTYRQEPRYSQPEYRPQNYPQQAYRQPHYAHPAYRPAEPHYRAAPARHEEHHDGR